MDVNRARGATMVAPRASSRRSLYVGTSVLMGLIAVVGFWPSYFGPLMRGPLAHAPRFVVNTDHWTAIVNWVIARAT